MHAEIERLLSEAKSIEEMTRGERIKLSAWKEFVAIHRKIIDLQKSHAALMHEETQSKIEQSKRSRDRIETMRMRNSCDVLFAQAQSAAHEEQLIHRTREMIVDRRLRNSYDELLSKVQSKRMTEKAEGPIPEGPIIFVHLEYCDGIWTDVTNGDVKA